MNHLKETILLVSLFLMNAAGFLVMFIDKQKARRGRWRIPERTLLLLAALGGSVGSLLGMYLFHHKTKHLKFTLGIPLILILQLLLAWLLCRYAARSLLPPDAQAPGRQQFPSPQDKLRGGELIRRSIPVAPTTG